MILVTFQPLQWLSMSEKEEEREKREEREKEPREIEKTSGENIDSNDLRHILWGKKAKY